MSAELSFLHFDNDEIETHIRVELHDDQPHFIAKDVCSSLGLDNTARATSTLDPDELVLLKVTAGGQKREMQAVTESGLYALIFKSTKPEAKAFRKWVTSVVLPDLRRRMMQAHTPGLPAEVLALLSPRARRAELEEEMAKLERALVRLRTQADLALVIPGQMSVYQWLLLQGEESVKGGRVGNLSSQCLRLADSQGIECGEVKVIEHCGQRVRLCRTARTFPEEILAEVCGQAAA